jgi:hypothetical protein
MITFKQFITEESDFDMDKFKKDCHIFLEKSKGEMIYHGSSENILFPSDSKIITWKERTRPRNTNTKLHEILNEFFVKKFGEKCRNWLFVTGSERDADSYNNDKNFCYAIFPIGEFQWLCEPNNIRDFFTDFNGIVDTSHYEHGYYDKNKDAIIEGLEDLNWEFNTNLSKCIKSEHEIMLKCNQYYAIKTDSKLFKDKIEPLVISNGKYKWP